VFTLHSDYKGARETGNLYWTWGKAINDKLMVCCKMAGHFYFGKNLKYEGILFLSANFKSK